MIDVVVNQQRGIAAGISSQIVSDAKEKVRAGVNCLLHRSNYLQLDSAGVCIVVCDQVLPNKELKIFAALLRSLHPQFDSSEQIARGQVAGNRKEDISAGS